MMRVRECSQEFGKKRIHKAPLAIALLLVLMFAMSGCSDSKEEEVQPETQEAVSQEEPTEAVPDEPTEEATAPSAEEGNADFRQTMDEYEAFMDGYIAFMTEYSSSDDTLGMMADYTALMADYADWMEKVDSIDEDSLSSEDLQYYLEVMGRVSQKLADASL